jgi:hypothetical protein
LVQVVAHPPQRPLADDAGIDVDPVLETAVDGDEQQQQQRQRHQVGDLRDREPEERRRKVLALDRVVDDPLRQLEIDVDQREADARQHEQEYLVAPRVAENVTEK